MAFVTHAFSNPYRIKTVAAGAKEVVWYEPVTGGYKAFVDEFANNWFANCYIDWIIDGELIERLIRYTGNLDGLSFAPKEFNPPIVANNFIKFIAVNNDVVAHTFEVFCNGYFAKPIRATQPLPFGIQPLKGSSLDLPMR